MKLIILIASAIFILLLTQPLQTTATRIAIDGEAITFHTTTIDNHTMVPIRNLFEQLGYTTTWHELSQGIELAGNNRRIRLWINRRIFIVTSGESASSHTLDIEAQFINGIVMAPMRTLLEAIGYTVNWDDATYTVQILTGRYSFPRRSIPLIFNGEEIAHSYVDASGTRLVALSTIPERWRTIMEHDSEFAPLTFFNQFNFGIGVTDRAVFMSSVAAQRIPVLAYHHLLPDSMNTNQRHNAMVVGSEDFHQQMAWLYENNYFTLRLSDMEDFLFANANLPERSVAIHFDDGYYSNFVYAYPILRNFGQRAAIFFITNEIEALGEYQPAMNHTGITWTAASTILGTESVFCTASHSHYMHHSNQGQTRSALYYATHYDIVADTLRSFDFVANHTAYVYPRNHYNQNVIAALQSAGVTHAFSGRVGYVTRHSNVWSLERFPVLRRVTLHELVQFVSQA